MRHTYDIKLKRDKETITVSLRLTLGGQINLKNMYKEVNGTALQVIFMGMDDPAVMADVFTECLTFEGNNNDIIDGEELYDLLVDNGYAGEEQFVPLLTSIAEASGLLSKNKKAAIDEMAINGNEIGEEATKNQ